ncbi:hypothetical protein DDV98_34440 [Streptomyces sp. IB2014 011-12]|nr:hypothetical protein DDV98_34440 [Streptomyces sp. IB2014 011-12]
MQLQGGGLRQRGALVIDDNAADVRAGPREPGLIRTKDPRSGTGCPAPPHRSTTHTTGPLPPHPSPAGLADFVPVRSLVDLPDTGKAAVWRRRAGIRNL